MMNSIFLIVIGQPKCPSIDEWIKKCGVYIYIYIYTHTHNVILLSNKKE